MDVKAMITDAVERISKDETLKQQFKNEPVKALESLLGVDLPDDVMEKIVDGVKAKMTADKLADVGSVLKKLF